MPSTASAKPLYIAKSMKDLDAITETNTDYKTKSTNQLISSATKLFQAAEKGLLDRDEERAYTLFVRYIEIIFILKKRPEFEKNPDYNLLLKQINTALVKAEKLKDSLTTRYPKSNEEIKIKEKNDKNEMLSSLNNKNVDISVAGDATNIIKTPTPEVEMSITSSKLFALLTTTTNNSNIVVMDIRPEKDYEQSHIKHECCINVPEEILNPGVTASTLEKLLPPMSLEKWRQRGNVDRVIFVDWKTKDVSKPSLYMNSLKEAMCKWDQKCSLKNAPLILLGGYKDWMLKYPMLTTQALNVFNSEMKTSSIVADLSSVEYPNLDESSGEKNKENLNGPGPLFKKSSVPISTLNNDISPSLNSVDSRKAKSAPVFDRKSKPVANKPTSANSQNSVGSNLTNHNKIPFSVLKSPSSEQPNKKLSEENQDNVSHLASLMKEELLAKDGRDIAKEQLLKEQEFENLCLRKEKEAEESKRIELQKQEDVLLEALKKLDLNYTAKDAEYKKVKEENMKMKKMIDEMKDKTLQAKKEKIMMTDQEKETLQEQVKRLREERKLKEAREKLESKPNAVPRNTVSANTGLKRPANSQDQNDAASSEYTVPLSRQSSSESGGRGLVRSFSSPNIAQLVNQEETTSRKMPAFDRSLKPPATPTYPSEVRGARGLRNLNPTYGNGPATGLRNLGNTCFMNSVLQCLANTPPLISYFMSGAYVHDINRDKRQNMSGEVAEEFAVVMINLDQGQYKSFSPKDFKNTVSKCLSVCIGNEQQDSHEFFVVLMEKLHADLNRKAVTNIPKLDPNHDENAFWTHHKSYNESILSDVFEGLLKSTLRCLTCRKTSDSFEAFSCLSLPISSSKCTLQECFSQFFKPEKISGEAAWDCPKCKVKKEAEKKLRICRLPPILAIQLKRFSYEGLWRRKLQTYVDFDFAFDVPYERNGEQYCKKYSLYGIVNHYGTLEGGHYIAFCKKPRTEKWYKYDDHEVSELSLSDIKTSAAYMLFYGDRDFLSSL